MASRPGVKPGYISIRFSLPVNAVEDGTRLWWFQPHRAMRACATRAHRSPVCACAVSTILALTPLQRQSCRRVGRRRTDSCNLAFLGAELRCLCVRSLFTANMAAVSADSHRASDEKPQIGDLPPTTHGSTRPSSLDSGRTDAATSNASLQQLPQQVEDGQARYTHDETSQRKRRAAAPHARNRSSELVSGRHAGEGWDRSR